MVDVLIEQLFDIRKIEWSTPNGKTEPYEVALDMGPDYFLCMFTVSNAANVQVRIGRKERGPFEEILEVGKKMPFVTNKIELKSTSTRYGGGEPETRGADGTVHILEYVYSEDAKDTTSPS